MANGTSAKRTDGWTLASLWWRVLRTSYIRYHAIGSHFMAAAIAFYALICLAPLGMIFAALLQRMVGGEGTGTYEYLERTISEYGGPDAAEIMRQIEGFLPPPGTSVVRTSTGLAGLVGLAAVVWAGLRLFDAVQLSLTFIWPGRRLRTYLLRKLVSLAMMAVAGLLLAVLVLSRVMLTGIEAWLRDFPQVDATLLEPLRPLGNHLLGFLVTGGAYLLLYKTMPVQRVDTRAAIAGAVCAALLWQAALPVFLYLVARSLQVNPVYGSLGSIVLFGLWVFLGGQVLLFGAQFAAAYEHVFVHRRPRGEDDTYIEAARRRLQMTRLPDISAEAERLLGELSRRSQAVGGAVSAEREVNAIVLTGGRLPHHLAEKLHAEFRGLVPVAGRPSVEYVLEALRGAPQVRKVIIVGDKEAYLQSPVSDAADGIVDEGPDIALNLLRAIRFLAEDRPLLLTAADTPLITSEALSDLLGRCEPEADLCYPLTLRRGGTALYRERYWAFLPLRDGYLAHTRNVVVQPELVLRNQEFIERFLSRQRDLLSAAGEVGLAFVLRCFLSWYIPRLRYDLEAVNHRIATVTGAEHCQGILVEHPEMALSLDTPADVAEAEAILRARGRRP